MISRRHHLGLALALGPAWSLWAKTLDPEQMEQVQRAQALITDVLAGRQISNGKVWVDLPPLVENGNSVLTTVRVSDALRGDHHVQRIHIIAEGNPLPRILTAHFTPATAKPAVFTSRVRLANSQRVWALAEWSDGRVWAGHADTIVTLSSCTEER
jgi:sulfur-oxidizing protein SoxY